MVLILLVFFAGSMAVNRVAHYKKFTKVHHAWIAKGGPNQ